MGILSDFFIANPASASSYDSGQGVPETDRTQWKGITPLQAAQMLAVLRRVPYDITLIRDFPLVHEDGEDGPWTQECPDDFVELLAIQVESDVPKVAAAWASATSTELGWSAMDFKPIVADLIRLARQAKSSGKSLYLWNCL
jgi:hypothetical protein